MLIAREKEKSNIAEYILYMWQVEDIIRSNNFDLTQISDLIISKYDVSEDLKYEIKFWYQNLIEQMMKEGISDKGHLSFTLKHIEELNNLHNSLLTTVQDKVYQEQYLKTKENISSFMLKSGGEASSEIHACLIALYGFLLLKLKQSEVSSSTKQAMDTFSKLIALLVDRYNKLKRGELKLPKEKSN